MNTRILASKTDGQLAGPEVVNLALGILASSWWYFLSFVLLFPKLNFVVNVLRCLHSLFCTFFHRMTGMNATIHS